MLCQKASRGQLRKGPDTFGRQQLKTEVKEIAIGHNNNIRCRDQVLNGGPQFPVQLVQAIKQFILSPFEIRNPGYTIRNIGSRG